MNHLLAQRDRYIVNTDRRDDAFAFYRSQHDGSMAIWSIATVFNNEREDVKREKRQICPPFSCYEWKQYQLKQNIPREMIQTSGFRV